MKNNTTDIAPLTVTIVGASGFVGQNLVRYMLENTDANIRAVCRHPEDIIFDDRYASRVQAYPADIFDYDAIKNSLDGADAAIYLIHMMGSKRDYSELEANAAETFSKAAEAVSLPRVIYMGGLGADSDNLSKHLRSRHHTGEILRRRLPLVIELRASMIIGDGSIGYDIMRSLVRKLPVQTMPAWAITKTQPITLYDDLQYIVASLTVPISKHEIIEIGGPEQMSYKDLVARYAAFKGKRPILILVPVVPLWLGAWWLNLFTPRNHAKVGRAMAESLVNPMIVTTNRASELFPNIKPEAIERAFSK